METLGGGAGWAAPSPPWDPPAVNLMGVGGASLHQVLSLVICTRGSCPVLSHTFLLPPSFLPSSSFLLGPLVPLSEHCVMRNALRAPREGARDSDRTVAGSALAAGHTENRSGLSRMNGVGAS